MAKIQKSLVKIPSDTRFAKDISTRVIGALKPYKVDASDIFDVRLCVEEAVINAIVHGNRRDSSKSVRVTYWIKDDKLNVEVEDEGAGFDHKHLIDPTADDNIEKGSGRGVFLIHKLMDVVEYNEAGNDMKMIKYL